MQDEMRLQDYIRVSIAKLWRNKFLIVSVTMLFFMIGVLYASWQSFTNTYYASATVYTTLGSNTQESSLAASALSDYVDIIQSTKVCERAESLVGSTNITSDDIKQMISVSSNSESTILTIAAYSEDANEAVEVVNAVADAFVTQIQSLTGNTMIQVLDRADSVRLSSNGMSGIIKTIMMATVLGFGLSVAIIVVQVIFTNKISTVEQCLDEGEDEILGIIPYIEEASNNG